MPMEMLVHNIVMEQAPVLLMHQQLIVVHMEEQLVILLHNQRLHSKVQDLTLTILGMLRDREQLLQV